LQQQQQKIAKIKLLFYVSNFIFFKATSHCRNVIHFSNC